MTAKRVNHGSRHETLQELDLRLRKLKVELSADVQSDRQDSEHQSFSELVGEVRDFADESSAESAADSERAVRRLHAEALNDVDNALARMGEGSYGVCTDCNAEISSERLTAYPTAKRCITCQMRYEKRHTHGAGTSL